MLRVSVDVLGDRDLAEVVDVKSIRAGVLKFGTVRRYQLIRDDAGGDKVIVCFVIDGIGSAGARGEAAA